MRAKEILYHVLEYALIFMFIRGGVRVLLLDEEPVALPGLYDYLVGDTAIFIYGLLFLFTGLALLYAKVFKKHRTHKWSLFTMFIICVYVISLSIALNGLVVGQLLALVVGVISAAMWLRWVMAKEYVEHTDEQA